MNHKVLSNAVLTIGGLKYTVDAGQLCLLTGEGTSYRLSACDTLALLNLLSDYKLDIVTIAHVEQREREGKHNQHSKRHKKVTDAEAEEIRQRLMQVFHVEDAGQ